MKSYLERRHALLDREYELAKTSGHWDGYGSALLLSGVDEAIVYRLENRIGLLWTSQSARVDDQGRRYQRDVIEDTLTSGTGFDDYAVLEADEINQIDRILRKVAKRAFKRERPFWKKVRVEQEREKQQCDADRHFPESI